jgi:hypothetical protein
MQSPCVTERGIIGCRGVWGEEGIHEEVRDVGHDPVGYALAFWPAWPRVELLIFETAMSAA